MPHCTYVGNGTGNVPSESFALMPDLTAVGYMSYSLLKSTIKKRSPRPKPYNSLTSFIYIYIPLDHEPTISIIHIHIKNIYEFYIESVPIIAFICHYHELT